MTDAEQARRSHAAGDAVTAGIHYERALVADPANAALLFDYALLLMQTGRTQDAAKILTDVRRLAPGDTQVLLALAACLREGGTVEDAMQAADEATRRLPHDAMAWMLKGSIDVRAGEYPRAEMSLRRALSLAPGFGEAWHYLGESLHQQQRWEEAIHAYTRASAEQPGEIYNIAMCAEQSGNLAFARSGYQQACRLYPDRPDILLRLAQTEARLCEFSSEHETLERFRRLVADGIPREAVLEAFPLTYLPLESALVQAALNHYMEAVSARTAALVRLAPAAPEPIPAGGRIRIGYLSADLGMHAVGQLVDDVFRLHDRERFEVFVYSLRRHDDAVASRIRESSDMYVECGDLGVAGVVERIRQDGIHVLIDLNGPTTGARLEILASRPAALQLGWLGFLHAQQAPWLDAILLDEHVQPSTQAWPFDDRVVRLPVSVFPPPPRVGGRRQRERFGLPAEGSPVLASFNNSYKLDAALVAAWLEIMRLAPRATLMVYLPPAARPGFLRQWSAIGGDPSRLMVVDALAPEEQADRAASCDLMLDAFRYQGGATTLDAVASGLPVLCRAGQTPPSRLGVSVNLALGLEELVVADTTEYVERAVWLANHPDELEALRHRVATAVREGVLFDARRSAAGIEATCERMLREKGILA